ncbi:peptide-N4-(N-acetyl-beta-glucosaminyl)asparagine amidase NDAI_0E02650 [Naumovozyma dairenensis CBS 421]|uniref:Peptide-N(4)-(N-acetyl-beta-glucosaminyl)asparagine amidase n=1 Tax=Naumovozyma dairenensis (strain ATCC 10597 / BCRC 20456 / CBS 421 / NBRC 0211 / NRRL Y-12639) TaxID=1071378 RepID=G0WBG2_NAUDC|nr:hypothetical protein NDAI_0E02650 [Naumovozyma dairenensis CBS 421]CCD25082.1 hypothetical protein NDAI_0E02650 [Naumovozyma dairenensis CBS 421]
MFSMEEDKVTRSSTNDSKKEINYKRTAEMFLTRYKDFIIKKFQLNSDERRFNFLLRSNAFARELVSLSERYCTVYENGEWYSIVLETLDLETIYENVDSVKIEEPLEYSDVLVKELLRYFKNDFFTWCDKPKCRKCHDSSKQIFDSIQGATREESLYGCGAVEVFKCSECNELARFPRYNDPIKLLETRTGRCGEWCNLFTLILRSFGLEARYIWNKEDHVWCEYYSPFLKRWVHVDSCEQSFDEPFIYSVNWNKKMSYCIAFNKDGMTDVSKRYILQNALPRNLISELDLKFLCMYVTKKLRRGLPSDDIYRSFCRDENERFEWLNKEKREADKREASSNDASKTSGITGRQSGAPDWKAQRNEDGR